MRLRVTGLFASFGLPRSYVLLCAAAALIPLWPSASPQQASHTTAFPGWPAQFEGKSLTPVPLSPRELRFYRDFTGRIAKFTDGKRQIVMRWSDTATHKFHLSERCYEAIGYKITATPLTLDSSGHRWRTFAATLPRNGAYVKVYELIYDSSGHEWTDEAAWRWACFWKHTRPPWWSITVAEPEPL